MIGSPMGTPDGWIHSSTLFPQKVGKLRFVRSEHRRASPGHAVGSRERFLKRGPFVSPRVGIFKRSRCTKNRCVRESSPDNLQPHRKPMFCETAGDGCRGL